MAKAKRFDVVVRNGNPHFVEKPEGMVVSSVEYEELVRRHVKALQALSLSMDFMESIVRRHGSSYELRKIMESRVELNQSLKEFS